MPGIQLLHRPSARSSVPSMGEGTDPASRASRLRQAREDAGLSREEAAGVLQVSPGTVKNWENPRTDAFPHRQIHEVAALYEVDYWWLLLGGEGHPSEGGLPAGVMDELREIRRLLDDLLRRRDE